MKVLNNQPCRRANVVGGHDIFYMLSASHACMMLLPQQQGAWDLTLSDSPLGNKTSACH